MADTMTIKVNTGAVSIRLEDEHGNELGTFLFNPLDTNILTRYESVIDFFNSVQFDDEETVENIKKLDADIAEQFDFLLGYKVSKDIFSKCGALTVTQDGSLYFENVLEQIAAIIEKLMKQRTEKKLKKIRAATAKYHK